MSEQLEENTNIMETIQRYGNFQITQYSDDINLQDTAKFQKIDLSSEQKMQISELMSHIPDLMVVGEMANAYKVKFPKGLPHTLVKLKNGGFGSQIIGNNGKIVGSASFNPMTFEAAVYGVFSVMSIATGQFFMCQINKELKQINGKLDEILKILYGDKKSELIAEIKFVQAACNNYSSIMLHEEQRVAVLTSIQDAKKLAIKDIDFFGTVIDDKLNALTVSDDFGREKNYYKLKKEILSNITPFICNYEMSVQLYIISCIMDVFFAQNFDEGYIDMVEKDIRKQYVNYCMSKMTGFYDVLITLIKKNKIQPFKKEGLMKEMEDSKVNIINSYEEISAKLDVLHKPSEPQEYCVTKDGTVYRVVL